MEIPRNNPGNIKRDSRWTWQGQQPGAAVGEIISFDTLVNGYRAMLIDLRNKIARGLTNIHDILYVYAPPTENDTEAYIKYVSDTTGISPRADIDRNDYKGLGKIVYAMSWHEHGIKSDDGTLKSALSSAIQKVFGVMEEIFDAAKKNPAKAVVVILSTAALLYLVFNN